MTLKQKLQSGAFITAPGIYDMMTLLLASAREFPAVFLSGYWGTAAQLGIPDAGLATYRDFLTLIQKFTARSDTPLIADADTGFGGLLNIDHTVKGYEAAGVAAIQLEDQINPKRCGHQAGKQVTSLEEMVQRVKVAVDARKSEAFLIIARTDARAVNGLDDAIERAQAYRAAGADILFVETPQNEAEMRRICSEVGAPQMVNMAQGGRTPLLSRAKLQEIGYQIAIAPSALPLAALQAMMRALDLLEQGEFDCGAHMDLFDFDRFNTLIGFPEIHAFEKKWAD